MPRWPLLLRWCAAVSLLAGLAVPASAREPQVVTIPALRELLSRDRGDLLVQFTSNDPACSYCALSNADLPGRLDRDGWTGRFLRVQWAPWASFPADLRTLTGVAPVPGVPTLVLLRDGREVDRVAGHSTIEIDQLLRRLVAPAVPVVERTLMSVADAKAAIAATGDLLLQVTTTDPACPPCLRAIDDLPPRLARDGWKGRLGVLAWTPFGSEPADIKTVPGLEETWPVPYLLLYRDGKVLDHVAGDAGGQVDAMLARHGVTAASPSAAQGMAPAPTIATLKVEPGSVRQLYGATVSLHVTALDRDARKVPGVGLAVVSSDPRIVSVDSLGHLHLLRRGKATVTVTAGAASASSQVEVMGFAALARTDSSRGCALPDDRDRIYCWGKNLWTIPLDRAGAIADLPVPAPIARGELPAGARIASVVVANLAGCALSEEGRVYCWGNSQRNGPLGRELPPSIPANHALAPAQIGRGEAPAGVRYTAIGLGPRSGCAAGDDLRLYCWGAGDALPQQPSRRLQGQLATPVAVARGELPAGAKVSEIALSTNGGCLLAGGEAYCWRVGDWLPKRVPLGERPGNDRITHLDSDDFTCALTEGGAAYCQGSAAGARFGHGSSAFEVARAWRAVAGATAGGFTALSEGGVACATCALDHGGHPWCWGRSHMGSAADGNLADHDVASPRSAERGEIPGDVRLLGLSCGRYHCTGLGDDGRLFGWGSNEGGALGRPPDLSGSGLPVLMAPPQPW